MDVVEVADDEVDPNSDGIVGLRVDEVVADLGLEYGGIEPGGTLVLYRVSAEVDNMSDEELTVALDERLKYTQLRETLGVHAFEIVPPP